MSAAVVDRDDLDALTEAGHLNADQRVVALNIAGLTPSAVQWHHFLSRVFLLFGLTLLIAAVSYFVAYNWDAMGRFAKIALLEIAVVVAALAAARFAAEGLASRAALMAAVLLTGPLLAFIGQTYQTGADTYELFRAWALLALPWVWLARWRVLWCAWLLIANVSVGLYFSELRSPLLGAAFNHHGVLALAVFNGAFLVCMEWWGQVRMVGAGRSVERLALALLLCAAVFLYFHFLLESSKREIWALLIPGAVLIAVWCWYRLKRVDLLALALWAFAAIAVAATTVAKLMAEGSAGSLAWLLTGMTVIGLSAGAATWLKQLHRDAEAA